jgi:hypothetical protein
MFGGLNYLLNHPNFNGNTNHTQFNCLADACDDFHSLLPTPLTPDADDDDSENSEEDKEHVETPEKSLAFYEVDPASLTLKRLKLPDKIPVLQSTPAADGYALEEFNPSLDTACRAQGVQKRSKVNLTSLDPLTSASYDFYVNTIFSIPSLL